MVEILIDPMGDGAAEAGGQLQINACASVRTRRERNDAGREVVGTVTTENRIH